MRIYNWCNSRASALSLLLFVKKFLKGRLAEWGTLRNHSQFFAKPHNNPWLYIQEAMMTQGARVGLVCRVEMERRVQLDRERDPLVEFANRVAE